MAQYGADERIIVLDADLQSQLKQIHLDRFIRKTFQHGIAEGNLVCVAAGLASTGKVVFASTFAIFASERACEQIRNSICYPKLNVKVAATHAGLTVEKTGHPISVLKTWE